jgi:hypothetical protein
VFCSMMVTIPYICVFCFWCKVIFIFHWSLVILGSFVCHLYVGEFVIYCWSCSICNICIWCMKALYCILVSLNIEFLFGEYSHYVVRFLVISIWLFLLFWLYFVKKWNGWFKLFSVIVVNL